MSHSVTVTRTTTTTSATAIILNTGFISTVPGLLKLFETILGAICLGLIAYYNHFSNGFAGDAEHTLFLLVTFAFMMTTFLLFLSSLISITAATLVPKTIFELLYHLFAFIFYVSASIALLSVVSRYNRYARERWYEAKMAAAVIGLINSCLYLISTVFSFRSYKSG